MRKTIILLMLFLMMAAVGVASTVYTDEPYSEVFTTEGELNKTLTQIRTELGTQSCYIDANWQAKSCDYLYYAYAILPSTSDNLRDALVKEAVDVTDKAVVELKVNSFVPPKGVLYYVVTFITSVHYTYNDATEAWEAQTTIPTAYANAHTIRNVCPSGQMLSFDINAGEYKCYLAQRICLDALDTGMCTNPHILYALDKSEDGVVSDAEMDDASNFCADRGVVGAPQGDGICDMVADLGCLDNCRKYTFTYTVPQGVCLPDDRVPNGVCDIYDQLAIYSCLDDPLSPNSMICDDIDAICSAVYNPVCVGGDGGQTYPNKCFAEAQGETLWTVGACEPGIVQCYTSEDCYAYASELCIGGSTTGITTACTEYMCTFNGACANLACVQDSDCSAIELPCVGVVASCSPGGFCTIEGSCLTQPAAVTEGQNVWDLILGAWDAFWQWILNIFT